MIYLDYNATTPCDEKVVEAMLPYFTTKFGNAASRTHSYGWVADAAVEKARGSIAKLIGASTQEIVFTSGATEACNLALKGVFDLFQRGTAGKKQHVVTCVTEHKAVLDTCAYISGEGGMVTYLSVNSDGLIDLSALEAAITPDTIMIAIMAANNETGVLQSVEAIGKIAKQHKVLFFCDATQAVGKIEIDVQAMDIDILALSAHKFYGPKGVGALYLRRRDPRVRLLAQIHGGGHERGFRSGTLNVPGIVGMGAAAELAKSEGMQDATGIAARRNRLESELLQIEGATINGSSEHRLPNVCNIAFNGINAERLLSMLHHEIAFSLGSACTSVSKEPSHVLVAMGLEQERIAGSIRLSVGRFTTDENIREAASKIKAQVLQLLEENNKL